MKGAVNVLLALMWIGSLLVTAGKENFNGFLVILFAGGLYLIGVMMYYAAKDAANNMP